MTRKLRPGLRTSYAKHIKRWLITICVPLTPRSPAIAGIDGLSIDTIELYERNMIDDLALGLVHGELPGR